MGVERIELTPEEWKHAGTMWRYQDDRGTFHIGHVQAINDFGGTDITYVFRDCASGQVTVVRGNRLGSAAPIDRQCETRDRIIASMGR